MKIIVTGATGFLGNRICEMLSESSNYEIIALGRNVQKGKILTKLGCDFRKVDLQDKQMLQQSIDEDVVGIIHSAALSSPWGDLQEFININQIGTRNLLEIAESKNIKNFVYISTPSVYFNFKNRLGVKETDKTAMPNWPSKYTYSKYLGENEVLKAQKINTIILRPRGLFGPGDTSIIPRLIKANRLGKLPIIGDGKTLTDLTYIDNVAHAAILALGKCSEQNKEIFNISNGEPVLLWNFLGDVLTQLGETFKPKKIPFPIVYTSCFINEFISTHFLKNKEPTLTRYTAGLLAKSLTLDITKAKEKLGYMPLVDMQEGKRRFIEWAQETEGDK